MEEKSFLKLNVLMVMMRVLGAAAQILVSIILARVLSSELLGIYAFVILFFQVGTRLFGFGVGALCQYKGAVSELGDVPNASFLFLFVSAVLISLIFSMFFIVPAYDLLPFPESIQIHEKLVRFWYFLPIGVFSFFVSLYFLGKKRVIIANCISVVPSYILLFYLVSVYCFDTNVIKVSNAYEAQYLIMGLLSSIFLFFVARKDFKYTKFHGFREDLFYSGSAYLNSVINILSGRVVILAAPAIALGNEVGYLVIARTISESLTLLFGVVSSLVFSFTASSGLHIRKEKIKKYFKITLVTYCVLAFLLVLMSNLPISEVYGEEYMASLIYIYWIVPQITIIGHQAVIDNYFFGSGKPGVANVAKLIQVVLIVSILSFSEGIDLLFFLKVMLIGSMGSYFYMIFRFYRY